MSGKRKRLLWIVNHKTLLPAEVPIFLELGYEVFIPKIIPDHPSYRSGVVTYEFDSSLTIPRRDLSILNAHAFYGGLGQYRQWSPTVQSIINEHFSVLISSISGFISPFGEAIRHFDGLVLGRVFGLTHPNTYGGLLEWLGRSDLIEASGARGKRYAFVQGYPNLAEIEAPALASNAHTVTVPISDAFFEFENTWSGDGAHAIMVCPGIEKEGYYRNIYEGLRRDFGDMPHRIFGRQYSDQDDVNILPYLSDDELIDLYRRSPVFIYPSTEPRHIHYSPIEAMIVGAPVLYMAGSLSDIIGGQADNPGRCADAKEMKEKGLRLLSGDLEFAHGIRSAQSSIVDRFRVKLAREQWASLLPQSV